MRYDEMMHMKTSEGIAKNRSRGKKEKKTCVLTIHISKLLRAILVLRSRIQAPDFSPTKAA
jgi:hypothetical protein